MSVKTTILTDQDAKGKLKFHVVSCVKEDLTLTVKEN